MDEIEEIKQKIDIVQFINQYVPLKRAGRNFKSLCPFHQEKTPSFFVSPERQIWHCFGACNEGGDIFKFLMKWENIEFYEALKILAKKAGVKLKRRKWLTGKAREKEKIYEINHLAGEFYHYLLTSHRVGKKALDYLSSRKIKKESIKLFSLGYAPQSWRTLLPFLRKKGYEEEEIEKAGLVIKPPATSHQPPARYYDRFRGRVIFPLKDHRGNIVGFSGRVLGPDVSEAKYINTPETLVYHKGDLLYGLNLAKKAIRDAQEAIITEGEFDVISSFQAEVENIVAIKGSALTENQARVLRRFTERVILALDADLAGDAAARRGIEIADQEGLFVKVIKLPKGSDPDGLIKKGVKLWRKAVKSAVPVYDFFLSSALARLKGEKPDQKRAIAKELLPIWAKIADPIVQAHYIKTLAQKLKISEESIVAALSKLKEELPARRQGVESKEEESILPTREKPREQVLEEYFLALLFKLKEIEKFLEGFFKEDLLECFRTPTIKKILEKLKTSLEKGQKFDISSFAQSLPKELLPTLDRLYLKNVEESFKKIEDMRLAYALIGEAKKKFEEEQTTMKQKMNKMQKAKKFLEGTKKEPKFDEVY